MGHVSPERYTSSALAIADNQGYYADSEEYAQARDRATSATENAENLDDIYEPLREVLKAAGGLTSLLPDGTALEFATPSYTTPVTVEGNSVSGGGSAVTVGDYGKYDVPVAVLVDKRSASSGEATMLAFRGLDNSRSFGERCF